MSVGLRLSIIVVVGVTLGVLSFAAWHIGGVLALCALSLSVISGAIDRRITAGLLWTAVALLAFAYGSHARSHALTPPPSWIFDADNLLIVEGRLSRDASTSDAGVRLELTDVLVKATSSADTPGTAALLHHDVLAIVGGTMASASTREWSAGRYVRMPIRLRVPAVIRNPGSPSVRWQELTRPFDLIGTVKSGSLVEVERGAQWEEVAASVRRYVRDVCRQWLAPLDRQTAAVVTAILIGDRAGLNDDVSRRLQAAGTFHVIAISGGNVAILTAGCLMLIRLFLRRERAVVLMTLLIVLSYGLVVGRDASVVRAVLAATLYLGLRLSGMVPRALNVLAFTALICAVFDPLMVLDVGAWLSFGASLGLIMVLPRLTNERDAGKRPRQRAVRVVLGLLLATVAAELMILPVAAGVFMRVGVAGLPLNFVAIPAMTVAQVSGLLLCAVAPWWEGGASIIATVAHQATSALIGSAALVEIAPWLSWRVPPPPLLIVTIYYAAILLALVWSGRRIVTRGIVAIGAACGIAMVTAPWTVWRVPPPGWLRVTVVDVGQGESIVLQLPNKHVLLLDAGGSAGAFDVGGRVVTPALWASGIRRLDWLAMTHGDVDHIGGVMRVAEDLRPREFWEGVPVPQQPQLEALRRSAQQVVWRRLFAGHQIEAGGASIEVLHPPLPAWERRRVRNDDSMVVRLRFGLVEILLTGDAGAEFETAFTADTAAPPIRLLKVGHHGSRTSTSEGFLDAYRPTAAVISAGQSNLFGHPAPMVLGRLVQRDIDVFRTDRDGAIVIETDGRVARVKTATGRELSVTALPLSPVAMQPPSLP